MDLIIIYTQSHILSTEGDYRVVRIELLVRHLEVAGLTFRFGDCDLGYYVLDPKP